MRHRALQILWPSFLMASVLESLVFSAVDPADLVARQGLQGPSPLGVYTLAFLAFWLVVSCAAAMTALLIVEQDVPPPP